MTRLMRSTFLPLLLILAFNSISSAQENAQARTTPAEELVAKLAAAKTDDERKTLLEVEKASVNSDLQRTLLEEGRKLNLQARFAQALDLIFLAQRIAEQRQDKSGVAQALAGAANVYAKQGKTQESLKYQTRSLALFEELKDQPRVMAQLYAVGESYRALRKFDKALEMQKQSLALSETLGDQLGKASAHYGIGIIYADQLDFKTAWEHYQKAVPLFEALKDKGREKHALLLSRIGTYYVKQGTPSVAREYYDKAIKLMKELGARTDVAPIMVRLADLHVSENNFEAALNLYREVLKLDEELGNKSRIPYSLNLLGYTYSLQGANDLALEYYQKAYEQFEATNNKLWSYSPIHAMAWLYTNIDDYDLALTYSKKALTLAEGLNNQQYMDQSLRQLGFVYQIRGDYASALDHYQRALERSEKSGDRRGIATALSAIGSVHGRQGNHELSLDFFRRSAAINESMANQMDWATSLVKIGQALMELDRHDQALEAFQKSLDMKKRIGEPRSVNDSLGDIGSVYAAKGDYPTALKYMKESLALSEQYNDRSSIADRLNEIAFVYEAQANHAEALKSVERSASLAREIGSHQLLWRARTIAGRAFRQTGEFAKARQAFDDAIASIETLRLHLAGGEREQQRFFENKVAPYHQLIQLLVEQGNVSEALVYAERAKARVLVDVLQGGRVSVSKSMTSQEQERESRSRKALASLNSQISRENLRPQPDPVRLTSLKANLQKARFDYEALQAVLFAAHPELKLRRGETNLITLNETSGLFPDAQSALLEYVVTDEKTHLFVITKGAKAGRPVEIKSYTLDIKRDEIARRVEAFRRRLARREANFSDDALQLYRLLLGPSEKALAGKTTLVLVPDGALWDLPFQALQSVENRYLIEDRAISYAPSLTVLREMIKQRDRGTEDPGIAPMLLAFGNPELGKQTVQRAKSVLMDENLSPLPEAEKLVNALPQVYGEQRSKIYTGTEAREDRAKAEASRFRVLQFATHGVLNDTNPMYSHVVLSQTGSTSEDGLLEAWEMLDLNLRADLVVLSACETARGRVSAGEGVIGMSWALFVAGSPATVVSQWKVESSSTTALMLEFHKRLKTKAEPANRMGRSAAMREAGLKLLRDEQYRHPFYWAGFVLVGDGR